MFSHAITVPDRRFGKVYSFGICGSRVTLHGERVEGTTAHKIVSAVHKLESVMIKAARQHERE